MIRPADDGMHKFTATFSNPRKTVHFGNIKYEDYTEHRNALRAHSYVTRHRSREHWNDPRTAGALAYWLLWRSPDLEHNITEFERRFNLSVV